MTAIRLLEAARARGLTVTTAESCTGGLVSGAITEVAGSSEIFQRGFVTYSNTAKEELLSVSPSTLNAYGAVSEEVAKEMANGALAASGAEIAVAVTGIAGPGGSDHKPEGRVCFGVATRDQTRTETVEFGAMGRSSVRAASVEHALSLLIATTIQFPHKD